MRALTTIFNFAMVISHHDILPMCLMWMVKLMSQCYVLASRMSRPPGPSQPAPAPAQRMTVHHRAVSTSAIQNQYPALYSQMNQKHTSPVTSVTSGTRPPGSRPVPPPIHQPGMHYLFNTTY